MRRRAGSVGDRARRLRFQRLVEQAVSTLPAAILDRLDNVDIVVEDEPNEDQAEVGGEPDGELFGLYEGTPLTERGSGYSLTLPDRIVIFCGPLERAFVTPSEIAEQVRVTVYHELAHHFGFDEDRIEELGLA